MIFFIIVFCDLSDQLLTIRTQTSGLQLAENIFFPRSSFTDSMPIEIQFSSGQIARYMH